MGNLILNFLQEQGILIVMGLMVLEGLAHQWTASRRYRRLRTGIQSLIATYGQSDAHRQTGQVTYGKGTEMAEELAVDTGSGSRKRSRRTSRRQEVGRFAPEKVNDLDRGLYGQTHEQQGPQQFTQAQQSQQASQSQQELDAQLLYLKQSLDRIAAGRDQKLEEEPRERRKLTPEQEAVIADILREYLS